MMSNVLVIEGGSNEQMMTSSISWRPTIYIIFLFLLSLQCTVSDEDYSYYNPSKHSKVAFLHIPKTAGASFRHDLNKHGNLALQKTEMCYQELYNLGRNSSASNPYMITFLRDPRRHVLSQFFECKYDTWGKVSTAGTQFPRSSTDIEDFTSWVNHFYRHWKRSKDKSAWNSSDLVVDDFNCYTPYNMQARALSDECVDSHHDSRRINYLYFNSYIHNFNSLSFVGVTDYYKLSFCMIWYYFNNSVAIKQFCHEKKESLHITHNVPDHADISIRYPQDLWRKVDEMTEIDSTLYKIGVDRLYRNFDHLHAKHNLDLFDIYNGELSVQDNIYDTFSSTYLDPLPIEYSLQDEEYDLVIGVLTRVDDIEVRHAWRRTAFTRPHKGLKFVFLVDNSTSVNIVKEIEQFNDVAVLPTKEEGKGVMFGLKLYQWFRYASATYRSKLYGKIDSDCFVCPDLIMKSLLKYKDKWDRLYYGWFHDGVGTNLYRADEFFVVLGSNLMHEILTAKYMNEKNINFGGTSLMRWINNVKVQNNSRIDIVEGNSDLFTYHDGRSVTDDVLQSTCKAVFSVYHHDYYKNATHILSTYKLLT